MSSPEHKQKIWNLIKDIKVGMLTTIKADGEMRARPMHLVQDDYDGTIWFYTSADKAKVDDIQQDHDICLTFSCPEDDTYVSMTGKARLTQDKTLIDKYWNPFVAAWFLDGKESDDVALLECKINKGEHWDSTSSKTVQLFEIAKANLTDTTPDMGENEEFGT